MLADLRAERAVLGGLLLRPATWSDVVDVVREDDFADVKHQAVFRAIRSLLDRGADMDIVAVASELEGAERLRMVGGMQALADLTDAAVGAHAMPTHARRLRDVAAARRLHVAATEVRNAADDALEDPVAWVERNGARLAESAVLQREDGAKHIRDLFHPAFKRLIARKNGEERGVPYGWPDLDLLTFGMAPSEYVVIAARPSCGKSALATDIARNVARRERIPCRVQSLEMSSAHLVDRMFAQEGRVGHGQIRSGRISETEMGMITDACGRLQNAPLWIDDTRGLTINELCSRVRQWRRDPKAGGSHRQAVVIVDYLQLVRPSRKSMSREQEVAEVSGGLQTLAGQTGCSLVVLAQLSRAVEQRGRSAKPMLSDLRESGAIEQDADTVMFVHRPDRSGETTRSDGREVPVQPGTTELIVAKSRNGETGLIPLHFVGRLVSFQSVERRRQEYP